MHRRHVLGLAIAASGILGSRRVHAALRGSSRPRWNGMLAAGGAIPAKMPLVPERVVMPRPDDETSSLAFHRNAHAGMPYELPIVVQGGSWPFVYELIDGPPGASLGRNHGDDGYGILRWTPATDGAFSFTVRVRDQDGTSVQFGWSGEVGRAWARFVDAGNGSDSSGDGSVSAPWRSLAHAYAQVQDGGGLCLRAGQYQAPGEAMNIAVAGGAGAGRIGSLFGWPGESAIIDCSTQGAANFAWYNSSDTYVAHLGFVGGPGGFANPRYFASLGVNHRCCQYRLDFDAPALGTAAGGGDDNNSCLFLGAGGQQRRHVAQVHCRFRRLPATNNGFSGIDTYQTRYLVVADNVYETPAPDGAPRYALWIKGGQQEDISVRGNRWTEAWDGASLVNLYMANTSGGFAARNIELCYNTVVASTTQAWGNLALGIAGASQDGARGPIWVYRNTFRGVVAISKRSYDLGITFENDVVVHDGEVSGGNTLSGKVMMIDPDDPADVWRDPATMPNFDISVAGIECHGRTSDGILDEEQRLQGAWRTLYLGTHGAEVATPDALFEDGFEQ